LTTTIVITSLFWFVLALVFACLEIEAEGKFGWAEKMPTWYRNHGLIPRIYGIAMGGKPLTGYHSFMFFLPIIIFHAQFFQGVQWSLQGELIAWAIYFAWCPIWDYLWFILNPHYTFENFRKKYVWWHAGSIWIGDRIPLDYVMSWAISIGIAYIALLFDKSGSDVFSNHLNFISLLFTFTIATIFFAPLYHRWYFFMRKTDDRETTHISHTL